MKLILLTIIFSTLYSYSFCQSVAINSDGSLPNASAILDVKSNGKGMLLPRTSTSSRLAIDNPAKGLIVYDTTVSGFWFYNGSAWSQLSAASSSGWQLTGNAGTNPANHFIGTTDVQPLRFRVNNSWAGEVHPTSGNVFFGLASGQSITLGQGNTAIGDHSLFANTDGYFNTAIGNYALPFNTNGYNNTSIGSYSLSSNTSGYGNTAVGRNTLFGNTSGIENTAVGEGSLLSNTIGYDNTGIGVKALYSNSEGGENTAIGYWALFSNTTGRHNTATGSAALYLNTIANHNTATGAFSLSDNVTGHDNTATGYNALGRNIDGNNNTTSGSNALKLNSTGWNNVANGSSALYNNIAGMFNTAIGYTALYSNTDGWYNTAIGPGALFNNIAGDRNIAIGFNSGIHPNTPNVFNTVSIGNDGLLNAYQNQVFLGNNSTGFIGGKVNWGVISDARIKNTVIEDVKGLDFIMRLRPVTYHISNKAMTEVTGNKETPDFPGKYDGEKVKYTGFIAQEVEAAAKAVGYDFSGYEAPKNQWSLYTIRYAEFVVPLVKAMQEQQKIIGGQQTTIEELKDQMAQMKREIELLKKKDN